MASISFVLLNVKSPVSSYIPKAKNVASSFEIFIFSFFKISTIKLVTAPISSIFLLSVSISQLLLLWWS